MRGVFLGTGGYHPNERRHTSCVFFPELALAFDAGTSAFRLAAHCTGRELNVVLSHAHLDHVCGLTYLLAPLLMGRLDRVRVHGTEETLTAVRQHLFDRAIFPLMPEFAWQPLAGEASFAGMTLRHCALTHPGGSCGYRLDDGVRSLAYITDTVGDGRYTEFIRGVDVLIHECTFPDDMAQWCQPTGHSHTSQVAELAREAGVKRLYLTHVDPQRTQDDPLDIAAARAIFPETTLAEDFMTFDW